MLSAVYNATKENFIKASKKELTLISELEKECIETNIDGENQETTPAEEEDITPSPYMDDCPQCPLEVFPASIQRLLIEAGETFNTPVSIPVASLLGLLSCLVGRTHCVVRSRKWREHGNLWVCIVAPSGVGKSPVMSEFFQHVRKYQRDKALAWDEAYRQYKQDLRAYSRKKEERGDYPEKPEKQRFYLKDPTIEGLTKALSQNPRGILWWASELSGMIAGFDRYSSGQGLVTKGNLISAYDGEDWDAVRVDDERERYIPCACISIFGALQPDLLRRSFSTDDEGMGFLSRFLFCRAEQERPDLEPEDDIALSPASDSLLEKISSYLSSFEMVCDGTRAGKPHEVMLSDDARKIFVQWCNRHGLETWARGVRGTESSIFKKGKTHALRIALLLHCLKASLDNTSIPSENPVSADTMQSACTLTDWARENTFQILRFLRDKHVSVASPVEQAIMEVLCREEELLTKNNMRISNAVLISAVNEKLGTPVDSRVVGKAAAGLGLLSCWLGKRGAQERGREIPPEKLQIFKSHLKTNVVHV